MSDTAKVVGLILLFPVIIAFSFYADYVYKKAIVRAAIQEAAAEAKSDVSAQ